MGYVRILFLDVTAWSSDWRLKFGGPESHPDRYRAFHKLLGNFLATSCISSNFFCFEQLICILNNFSSYFLILTYRSSFFCLNWPFFHISQCFSTQFMNFLLKKGPNPPPWGRSWAPDRSSRARSAVFGENSKLWTKVFTWLTWVSRVKKVVQQFVFCIYFSNML